MSVVISNARACLAIGILQIVTLASGCATFDTARHLVGAAPQPREALTLEQLEAAERDVSKAQLGVEDAMMELAIAERHVKKARASRHPQSDHRRPKPHHRGGTPSEDTINVVKSVIADAGDAAEGSSGPSPTR